MNGRTSQAIGVFQQVAELTRLLGLLDKYGDCVRLCQTTEATLTRLGYMGAYQADLD
jgi:hypothetical protein